MEHQAPKVVNITTLKQATWIKSKLQQIKLSKTSNSRSSMTSSSSWTQVIRERSADGTGKILAEYREKSRHLSPTEVWKQHGGDAQVSMRKETTSTALTSESSSEDASFVRSFSSPASKETILAHLVRASALIPIKGTNKYSSEDGDVQTSYLLTDFSLRLMHNKATELDIFLALEALIETEEFFPSYAKLHRAVFGKAEAKAA